MKTLNEIADAVHANAREKGFHDNPDNEIFLANQCCNLHAEVSELWDSFRAHQFEAPCDKAKKMEAMGLEPLTCAEEEYADIVIRALDQCRRLGIDIQRAIEIKHAYNKTRPHMHGKKN